MRTNTLRASHVNAGTSVPADELPWPEDTDKPVLELPKLHMEIDRRSEVTPYGGLALAAQVAFLLKIPKILNRRVSVLKRHLPYHESDHVLAQAFNLYCGGTCIEDMANLQQSEAVLRLVGACRIPDPTTAGDFLRRFDDEVNPGSLEDLRAAIDEIQNGAWKKTKKRRKRRKGLDAWTMVDVDGHWAETTGVQKEADFDRKGRWGYHPLVVTLGGTHEILAARNRIGIQRSSTRAAEVVRGALARVREHLGKRVLTRADSDFDCADMRAACEEEGGHFAIVGREFKNRPGIAESIPDKQWKPFRTRAARQKEERKNERCDQEKVIAQLGSGIAAWRNPVAELAGNRAWLEIARLAWNLGKWVAQLALPTEVVRWEWKRFRHAFVVVPAQVLRRAAQIWLRVSGSHRFAREFLAAHVCLQR